LEEEIRKLDSMGIFASAVSKSLGAAGDGELASIEKRLSGSDASAVAGASAEDPNDTEMLDTDERTDDADARMNSAGRHDTVPIPGSKRTPASNASSVADNTSRSKHGKHPEPLSPPISRSSSHPNGAPSIDSGDGSNTSAESYDVFAQGGVPWYLEPFDPVGTTVHEERYTGRAVLRDMSEELSDMDEAELTELSIAGADAAPMVNGKTTNGTGPCQADASALAIKKPKKKVKGRRNHWSRSGRA